jgi:hypothetical protein
MCIPNDRSGSSELFFANFSSTPLAIRDPNTGNCLYADSGAIYAVGE